jgi:hypothetical protein
MADARKLVVGAEDPHRRGRWIATIMLPTRDPASTVTHALSTARIRFDERNGRSLLVSDLGARVSLSRNRRPGGSVSDFVLGVTAMMRGMKRRGQALAIERLCARVYGVTLSLASVVATSSANCAAVALPILAASHGGAFDLTAMYMPSGRPVMTFRDRHAHEAELVRHRIVVATFGPHLAGFRLRTATSEVWNAPAGPDASTIVSADAISRQLTGFADFASSYKSQRLVGHASRQVELAEVLGRAKRLLVLESKSPDGLSAKDTAAAYRIAKERGGLLFDEYGVYRSDGEVVFAPWAKKLAPLPSLVRAGN